MKSSLPKDYRRLFLLVLSLVSVLTANSFCRISPTQKELSEILPYFQIIEEFNATSSDLKISFNQNKNTLIHEQLLSIQPDNFAEFLQIRAQAYYETNMPEIETKCSALHQKNEYASSVVNLPKYFYHPLVVSLETLLALNED